MRALLVSTSYPRNAADWRGVFMRHLVDALARVQSLELSIWAPPGELPGGVRSAARREESQWLAHLMEAGGIAHLFRSGGLAGVTAPFKLLRMLRNVYRRETAQDLYHVNWLQNALALPADGRPLLTTALGTDMQLLDLPGMTTLLRRTFKGRAVVICPNAEWMVAKLQERFGDLALVRHVAFGIEPRWFALERAPASPARWLCVSRLTRGKLGTLFDWGEQIFADGRFELHLFGPMQEDIRVPAWVKYHGAASAESLCTEWFPKARGLITLSQHAEGRPQVMLEAMAAGLPVIASRLAAHEDFVHHRETGWLCGNVDELREGINALDDEDLNHAIGLRARAWAQANVGTWDDCAMRYFNSYGEIVRS